jgi:hypothetical protein
VSGSLVSSNSNFSGFRFPLDNVSIFLQLSKYAGRAT